MMKSSEAVLLGLALAPLAVVGAMVWASRDEAPSDAGEGCVCVQPNRAAQREAARRLVNPTPFLGLADHIQCANGVAGLMAQHFTSQQFRWVADPPNCDRWCPPQVTVERGAGHCDDWAIVAASILGAVRVPAFVVLGTLRGGGHAWVEGHDNHGWFLLEDTNGTISRQRPTTYVVHDMVRT